MTDGVSSEAINKFVTEPHYWGRKAYSSGNHEAAKANLSRSDHLGCPSAYVTLPSLTELVDPQQAIDRDIIRRAMTTKLSGQTRRLKLKRC